MDESKMREECHKKALDLIAYLQCKYPVNEWEINGIKIWPFFRVNLCDYFLLNINTSEKQFLNQEKVRVFKKFKNFMSDIINAEKDKITDINGNFYSIEKRDVLIHTYASYRRAMVDGKYYLTEVQPFLDKINTQSHVIYESCICRDWAFPRWGQSVLMNSIIAEKRFFDRLKRGFRKKIKPKVTCCCEGLEEAWAYMQSNGIKQVTLNMFLEQVCFLEWIKNIWVDILKIVQPKLVVMEYYYGVIGFALILAAKELGIKTADLQHGMQYTNHEAYGGWLPCKKGYQLLPDYFFVWSKAEKENIEAWSKDCAGYHRAIITGHLWFDKWKNGSLLEYMVKDKEYLLREREKQNELHILFVMDYCMPEKNIINLINSSPDKWRWHIRLHPSVRYFWEEQIKDFKKKITTNNVDIIQCSIVSLPTVLSITGVVITNCSTVAREGLLFGHPVIVENINCLEGMTEVYRDHIMVRPMDRLSLEDITECVLKKRSGVEKISNIQDLEEFNALCKTIFES